jgi:hypothetical protein
LNWSKLGVSQVSLPKNLAATTPASAHGYVKPTLGGGRPDAPLTTAERHELAQLRRQLRQITQERDILAKATAWFANKDSVHRQDIYALIQANQAKIPTQNHVQTFAGLDQVATTNGVHAHPAGIASMTAP